MQKISVNCEEMAVTSMGWASGRTFVLCTGPALDRHPRKDKPISDISSPLAWRQKARLRGTQRTPQVARGSGLSRPPRDTPNE